MDCAPLNLAHFHERRADKFLRQHRYDDAKKAMDTSLLNLQNAYKNVALPKSIEVLNTQKWCNERKLRQIQMQKQQHERLKLKEIVPPPEGTSAVVTQRPDNSVTAQSVAKSIDKTIEDFDAKFGMSLEQNMRRLQLQQCKENQDPKLGAAGQPETDVRDKSAKSERPVAATPQYDRKKRPSVTFNVDDSDEMQMPSLAPLELPAFDLNVFTTSSSIAGLAESFQK